MTKTLLLAACLVSLSHGGPKTETGEINGARFRIDMPEKWNGGLVMYCHGYNPKPVTYEDPKPVPFNNVFVDQGYAFAESGYAAGGWAIQEALEDTEALRRYFSGRHGKPKETYVTGRSMGGLLTLALMEMFPNSYDAGLPLCGPLGASTWVLERRPFDMRVVFDYYFPRALPSPVDIPAAFERSRERNEEIQKLLDAMPESAGVIRRYTGIHTNRELADTLVFFTYLLKELEQRAGGNPFDNRNIVYAGTPDDNALNDGVKRYASSPRATEYVRAYYTPTGRLTHPMLAVHTTYDPLVPAWMPNSYSILTEMEGAHSMFVQQYVKRDGHCAINNEEVGRAFAALREWKTSGKRPRAGASE